jgi:hypothetical protein
LLPVAELPPDNKEQLRPAIAVPTGNIPRQPPSTQLKLLRTAARLQATVEKLHRTPSTLHVTAKWSSAIFVSRKKLAMHTIATAVLPAATVLCHVPKPDALLAIHVMLVFIPVPLVAIPARLL